MIAFLRRLVDPRERLRHALAGQPMPVLPSGHIAILEALRSDKTLPEVGAQIGCDPGLTTTLLRTVNSAAFGLKKRVSSPAHAASLLGRSSLESLVLSVVVAKNLPRSKGFDHQAFWTLSAQRATTARALAQLVSPRDRDLCFTAGLLQDLAQPLLYQARPEVYHELLAACTDGVALAKAEQEAFGFDHAEAAEWLAAEWRFPTPLLMAIGSHHHATEGATEGRLPVLLSALLHDADGDEERLISSATDQLGLPADRVVEAVELGATTGGQLARTLTR